VIAAERADLVDGLGRGAREPQRLLAAAYLLERPELRPPAEDEAAVAAARAAAADVGLDDRDVQRRIVLLQAERGPETGIAAAHDADVGALLALEPGSVLSPGQRLLEPEASHGSTVLD